jgi:PKD repeat protein
MPFIATFTDPGGAELDAGGALTAYTATINWGDGTTSPGIIHPNGGNGFMVFAPAHTYVEEGTYFVTVSVQHEEADPLTTETAATVTVNEVPITDLTGSGATLAVDEGSATAPITGLATFTDPGGAEPDTGDPADPPYTALIHWGDGTTSTGTVVIDGGHLRVDAPAHLYAEEGTYTATVDVTHEAAATLTVTAATITVNDVAVTINPGSGATVSTDEGGATADNLVVGTFTDPGNTTGTFDPNQTANDADYVAVIDWGDTTTTTLDSFNNPAAFKYTGGGTFQVLAPAHTYGEEGSHTISLSVAHHQATDTQLVVNGGFENFFDGWNRDQPSIIEAFPHGGLFSAELGFGANSLTFLSQTIATVPGQRYVLSYFLGFDSGVPNRFQTSIDGAVVFDQSDMPGQPFTQYSVAFAAAADTTTIQFGGYQPGEGMRLDDVSVVPAPRFASGPTPTGAATVNETQITNLVVFAETTLTVREGETFRLNPRVVATFTDPAGAEPNSSDPDFTNAHYTATINWGDGTTSPGTVINTEGNDFRVDAPAHTYAEEGSYTVTVEVTHETADTLTVEGAVITVNEVQLTDFVTAFNPGDTPTEGTVTGPVTVATFTDPAGAEPADGRYTATIDWGDGTGAHAGTVVNTGGNDFAIREDSHRFATRGTYTLTVTVQHETTALLTQTQDYTVVAPPITLAPTGPVAPAPGAPKDVVGNDVAPDADHRFVAALYRALLGREASGAERNSSKHKGKRRGCYLGR